MTLSCCAYFLPDSYVVDILRLGAEYQLICNCMSDESERNANPVCNSNHHYCMFSLFVQYKSETICLYHACALDAVQYVGWTAQVTMGGIGPVYQGWTNSSMLHWCPPVKGKGSSLKNMSTCCEDI